MTNEELLKELGSYLTENSKHSYNINITDDFILVESFDGYYWKRARDGSEEQEIEQLGKRILWNFDWLKGLKNESV
tara:strand:+ start:5819 stop:6046 length:228 start_codon:yes stop_codon:yes gene_type:complete